MGTLSRFKLSKYIAAYNLASLFETGTFQGGGVNYALESGFKHVYSSEIVDELFEANKQKFANQPNVTLFHGNSAANLNTYLPDVQGNTFFWLDAHYPGAEAEINDYNDGTQSDEIRYPLPDELEAIKQHRKASADVILIDDLRMYLDGDFDLGNTPDWINRPDYGIEFIEDLFSESHHFVKFGYDTGYLLLLPKTQKPRLFINVKLGERLRRAVKGRFSSVIAD